MAIYSWILKEFHALKEHFKKFFSSIIDALSTFRLFINKNSMMNVMYTVLKSWNLSLLRQYGHSVNTTKIVGPMVTAVLMGFHCYLQFKQYEWPRIFRVKESNPHAQKLLSSNLMNTNIIVNILQGWWHYTSSEWC